MRYRSRKWIRYFSSAVCTVASLQGSVESGDTSRHIYVPTDSIVSLLYVLQSKSEKKWAVTDADSRTRNFGRSPVSLTLDMR